MPEAAARLHDPISHSPSLGLLVAGAVIGGALATLAVLTAPVSVPVLIGGAMIAGGAVAGAGIGEFVGSLSFARSIQGEIATPGSANVFVNGHRAARAHLDMVDCRQHSAGPVIAQGSDSVSINGQPAARRGDRIACDALIEKGAPNVNIGGGTRTTDPISPEVPDLVHKAMLAVGLGSAMILFGAEVAILGLAGGLVGGEVMHAVGGAIFGEGSDGQKIMAFGGSLAGGLGTGKGTAWFNRNYQIRQTGLGMNGGGISVTRRSPAARAADKGFPGIGTTPNGGPTFKGTDHLHPVANGQRNVVDVELTGSRRADFKVANREAGFDRTPDEYTWHHVDDYNPATGRSSMELVSKEAHRATYPHHGSVSQHERATGQTYRR